MDRFLKALATGDEAKARNAFTNRLYNHLIQHCEFIAHFNNQGFFGTYFTTPDMTKKFVQMFNPNGNGQSIEYGMTGWLHGDYADINEAIRQATEPYLKEIMDLAARRNDEQNMTRAQQALANLTPEQKAILIHE